MKHSLVKWITPLILFIGFNLNTAAQVGTTFWFVAPETTNGHDDEGALFRITAFDDAATVTISMPAYSEFSPITINIAANNQEKVELDTWLTQIEDGTLGNSESDSYSDWDDWTSGTPFNKGILIESDVDISAYYEIANKYNPDRFTLKGDNALGKEFYIPSQNLYPNYPLTPAAREQVDIVATEDDTNVTITITADVKGNTAGSTFTVTLNKGQTYCLRSTSGDASVSLGGTHIVSDKDIAVTISDDSVRHSGITSYDLIGDQIVPISVIGNEYIAVNTLYDIDSYTNTAQKIFITATEDNTEVTVNGTALTPSLNAGEMLSYDITNQNFDYITSNNDIYVYQISSVAYEMGSALVPSIECTGSTSVSFSRIYSGLFAVQIMTQYKNIKYFSMTPANLLSSAVWNRVEETGDANDDDTWYACVIDMNASTETVYTISNSSGLFHLSVLDANGSSMSYGYFSSFNSIKIEGVSMSCVGEEITLSTSQDASLLTWEFQGVDDVERDTIATDVNSITAEEDGTYYVSMEFSGCLAEDEIEVEFEQPEFYIKDIDEEICYDGLPITLESETVDSTAVYTYQWYDDDGAIEGATDSYYEFTPTAGSSYNFSLEATDTGTLECTATDDVSVSIKVLPQVTWDVSGTIEVCLGEMVTLDVPVGANYTYQWYLDDTLITGETEPAITPTISGTYSVDVTNEEECTITLASPITVHPLPDVTVLDATECPGTSYTFATEENNFASYQWLDASDPYTDLSTSSTVTLTEPMSELVVIVENEYGCAASDTAEFEWYNEHVFTFGNDTSVCLGNDITIEIDDQFTNYLWFFNDTTGSPIDSTGTIPTANDNILYFSSTADSAALEGTYYVSALDQYGCDVSGDFYLDILPPVEFDLEYDDHGIAGTICEGDSIKLIPVNDNGRDFTTYSWFESTDGITWDSISATEGGGNEYLVVKAEGYYKLEAIQDNACKAVSETSQIGVNDAPDFTVNDAIDCPDADLVMQVTRYIPGDISDPLSQFDYINWWHPASGVSTTDEDYPNDTYTTNEAGYYAVTVYDKLGCFKTETATAEYYAAPPTFSLSDTAICANDLTSFNLDTLIPSSVTDDPSYDTYTNSWSEYDGTPSASPDEPDLIDDGTYILTITTSDGCIAKDTVEIEELPSPTPPVFSSTDSDVCIDEEFYVNTDDDYTAYQWYYKEVLLTDEVSSEITPSDYGSGDYTVQVWFANGCSNTNTINITVNPSPTINLTSDTYDLCAGVSLDYTLPDAENYSTIYWSNGTTGASVVLDEEINIFEVVDSNGCRARDTIQIIWHPLPEFELGEDLVICPVDYPIILDVPDDILSNENVTYEWLNKEDSIRTSPSIEANLLDTVNILLVTDNYNCQTMDTRVVTLETEPNYDFGDDADGCEPEFQLNAGDYTWLEYLNDTTYYDVLTYQWYGNSSLSSFTSDELQMDTINVNESGQYLVKVFDGCWYKTDTFNVTIHSSPVITGLDTMLYAQVTVLTDPDQGTQPFTYTLNEETEQDENTFTNVSNGEYTILVEDYYGCTTSTVFSINSNYEIEVPNFFTPNGDGTNDTWNISGIDYLPDSDIRIYDRYGKLLIRYKASEPAWDGTYLNKPLPSDDYWYVIELNPVNKILKGHVSIKR
jgi:gliding motility-associated-like protein